MCKTLGVRGDGISAELHKMLLYEKRAIVKHHDGPDIVQVDELKNDDEPVKVGEPEKKDKPVDFDEIESNDKRVNIYELKNKIWCDRGSGFCAGQLLASGEGRINIRSEDDAQRMLLETRISHDYIKGRGRN